MFEFFHSRQSPKALSDLSLSELASERSGDDGLGARKPVHRGRRANDQGLKLNLAAEFQRDESLGQPLKANVRDVFVDEYSARPWWNVIYGKGPDGEDVHLGGTGVDVVCCAADGLC